MKNIFLLDMDETLLDFSRTEKVNFCMTLEKFGINADERIYKRFHEINDSLWKLLEKGGIERDVLKVRRFELLFAEFGVEADSERVANAYFANFEEICFPFDGATDFLKMLTERGRVYIVTNGGTRIQKRHLHDAGFEPFIECAFISEEIGVYKPSQAYADYVKAHIPGFEEGRAVWIGDSLSSDMVCAERAGVDFILYAAHGVPTGYKGVWADSYERLTEILNQL